MISTIHSWLLFVQSAQVPIIALMIVLSFRLYRLTHSHMYLWITSAWAVNFLYMLGSLLSTHAGLSESNVLNKYVVPLFDMLTSFLVLVAVVANTKKKRRKIGQPDNALAIILVVSIAFTVLSFLQLSPATDLRPLFKSLFSCLTFFYFSWFFRRQLQETKLRGVYTYGAYVYAGIQLLPLLAMMLPASEVSDVGQFIAPIGFTLGLLSKALILYGLMLIHSKLAFHKIQVILEEAFHEIKSPLQLIRNELIKIYPEDDDGDSPIKALAVPGHLQQVIQNIENGYQDLLSRFQASVDMYSMEGFDASESVLPPKGGQPKRLSINYVLAMCALNTTRIYGRQCIRFENDYGGNCYVWGSPYDLAQVFMNLFKNAIEAKQPEQVTLLIRTRSRHTTVEGLEVKGTRVWITDDGPGIPETDQAIVFERGYSTKEGPIHGHGLAIVERVVREHGGSVSATKGVDLPGAMFIITFPAPPKLNG